MKKIKLALATFMLLMTGCVRYQYLCIESSLTENDQGFVAETDSIKVSYWFQKNGAMEIEVRNLSDQLVYVDWAKSALIQQGQSFSLANNQSTIDASTSSVEWIDGIEQGDISGTITSTSSMNFIPGGSFIRYRTLPLQLESYDLNGRQGVKKEVRYGYTTKSLNIDRIQAKGFQTLLFVADESDNSRSIYEHEFWVSKVTETQYNGSFAEGKEIQLSEVTDAGMVLGTVGALAVLTVVVIAADAEE